MKQNLLVVLSLFSIAVAQSHRCGTMQFLESRLAQDPTLRQRMIANEQAVQQWIANNPMSRQAGGSGIITIPTVVHVIWNDPVQNVSDAQIYSQIEVLNKDFRLMNSDSLQPSHPFWQFTVDSQIEFCLAKQDPFGNPTTGITRTQTNVVAWDDNNMGYIKSTANGGYDNWDPTKYLNMYVVNLSGGLLGFATFPDQLSADPSQDGVVIRYEAFGTEGTAGTGGFSNNNGGRTATHEVGHWLFLRHIWGDSTCADDFVQDTPPAEQANYNCPTFPHKPNNSCGGNTNGEMYMNYMDYVDDGCMNMFTLGQATRMRAAINNFRSGLLTSNGCQLAISVQKQLFQNVISVYPNPTNGQISVQIDNYEGTPIAATLVDLLGITVKDFGNITSQQTTFSVQDIASGVYFLKLKQNEGTITKKIILHTNR